MSRGNDSRERPGAPPPWYRQLWPWLLMLMPALAVVSGVVTFWLASTTNNALVVDDYYREGKAINRQLARDETARRLGLAAVLSAAPEGGIQLRLTGGTGTPPPFLTLRLVHATREELDFDATVSAVGDGIYRGFQVELPTSGRWNVLLEDPERTWRLTAAASGFSEPLLLGTKMK